MLQDWLIELGIAISKVFLNPLLYWVVILAFIVGYKRLKRERRSFGKMVYSPLTEWKATWGLSVVFSIILSIVTVALGIVLTFETIIILAIVTIILGLIFSLVMLSASYTIGITYILLMLLPFVDIPDTYFSFLNISVLHFTSLAFLVAVFLFMESILIHLKKGRVSLPAMEQSNRGIWIGKHHLKKLAFIPFFVFIPTDSITIFAPFWPYFDIAGQSYSLILVPFIIGFDYQVRSELPIKAARKLSQSTLLLSLVVFLFAIGSVYFSILSFVAIVLAIIGKEWITYKHRTNDKEKTPYFRPLDKGIKVLAVVPDAPADRLGILIGEIILKVNGHYVSNSTEFYEALQNSGAFFKLDILDVAGEIRFINSAFYEGDHYELGMIFPEQANPKETKIEK